MALNVQGQAPFVQTRPCGVVTFRCSNGLCSVDSPGSVSHGADMPRPAQALVVQALPCAAQAPVLLTRPGAAKDSVV